MTESTNPLTGVILALSGTLDDAIVRACQTPGSPLNVTKRCADLVEAMAAMHAGFGRVALIDELIIEHQDPLIEASRREGVALVIMRNSFGEGVAWHLYGVQHTVAATDTAEHIVSVLRAAAGYGAPVLAEPTVPPVGSDAAAPSLAAPGPGHSGEPEPTEPPTPEPSREPTATSVSAVGESVTAAAQSIAEATTNRAAPQSAHPLAEPTPLVSDRAEQGPSASSSHAVAAREAGGKQHDESEYGSFPVRTATDRPTVVTDPQTAAAGPAPAEPSTAGPATAGPAPAGPAPAGPATAEPAPRVRESTAPEPRGSGWKALLSLKTSRARRGGAGRGDDHASPPSVPPGPPGEPPAPGAWGADAPRGAYLPTARAGVLTVWGPVGSPGRSTLAVNLAVELASDLSVILIDADTYGPSLAQLLGASSDSSGLALAARAASSGTLDGDALNRLAIHASPGLRLISGLPRPERWIDVRRPAYEALLQTLKRMCDLIIIDAGFAFDGDSLVGLTPQRNGVAQASLTAADVILAVTTDEPVVLTRFIRDMESLRQTWGETDQHIAINRKLERPLRDARSDTGDVEHLLHDFALPLTHIPAAHEPLRRAMAQGLALKELDRKHPARGVYARLAATLASRVSTAKHASSGRSHASVLQ
ncbi:P-loop NTPase [Micrococcales bacterium 31B]|nr:P-loop NTPase [Micrococcales bacterium 31B]